MRRLTCVGLALGILLPVVATTHGDEKVPSVADIMAKAHKKNKLRDQIKAGLEKSDPDWAMIQKQTKEFVTLADALGKNDPPQGDKASWKKLSKEYADAVKDLDETAGKKNAKAGLAANEKLGTKCMDCHDKHRE